MPADLNPSGTPRGGKVRPAAWRQDVVNRVARLRTELDRLDPPPPGSSTDVRDLRTLLDEADGHARAGRRGVGRWWWGTDAELAWGDLRVVEERMVDLLPDSELDAAATEALVHAHYAGVGAGDERVAYLQSLRLARAKDPDAAPPAGLRPAIVDVLRGSHDQYTRAHVESRMLRNRLVSATAMTIAFAVLLVLAQWRMRDTPFISTPADWHAEPWAQLLATMLFGTVGALFTAIPAMSSVRGDFSPFNLPLPQALLKVAVGAVTAVAGLAALEAVGGTDAELRPETVPQLLALAFLFGAAQQTVTRYVDKRADGVLASTDTTSLHGPMA